MNDNGDKVMMAGRWRRRQWWDSILRMVVRGLTGWIIV